MYDLDKINENIGNRVKAICDEKQITREQLCKEADLSRATISYLFRGLKNPDLYTVLKICNALDVTISELLNL